MRWLWWWWEYRGMYGGNDVSGEGVATDTIYTKGTPEPCKYSSQSCHCFYLSSLCALFVSIWVCAWAGGCECKRAYIQLSREYRKAKIHTIQYPYKYHTKTIQSMVESIHFLHTYGTWPNGKVYVSPWEHGCPFTSRRWLVHWAYCSSSSSSATQYNTIPRQRENVYKGTTARATITKTTIYWFDVSVPGDQFTFICGLLKRRERAHRHSVHIYLLLAGYVCSKSLPNTQ